MKMRYDEIASLFESNTPRKMIVEHCMIGIGTIAGITEALAAMKIEQREFRIQDGDAFAALPYLDGKGNVKYALPDLVKNIHSGITVICVETVLSETEIKRLSTLVEDARGHVIVILSPGMERSHAIDDRAYGRMTRVDARDLMAVL